MEIVKLTPEAVENAGRLLTEERSKKSEAKDAGLRIAVTGGGCSGLRYSLSFKNEEKGDEVHQYLNGVKIFIDQKSAPLLCGSTLEFHDGLNKSGFEVINPNACNSCGCGESFSM